MRTIAIQKARDHLDLARQAVSGMDITLGFKTYEQAWSQFLTQVSRFYSKLEQGSKGCGKSVGWYGRIKHQRRKDPLLSYLHHARDSDEHSIEDIVRRRASGASIKFPSAKEVRFSANIRMNSDGTMEVQNQSIETPDGRFTDVEVENPRIQLVTVRDDRFGDKFDPPKEHMGAGIIDTSPLGIANIALEYLEATLQEALELPQRV